MNFITQLEDILGDRHIGVKFNGLNNGFYGSPDKPIKFFEAVISSITNPIQLKKKDIDCLGARRAFGFYHDDNNFAIEISKETKIPYNFIKKAIAEIPIINFPIDNILLASNENPDVKIAFVKPYKITKLIFLCAVTHQEKPMISPYFFMSVCANTAVQTLLTNKICISFGCPESRKESRVLKDEVIVGIPGSLFSNQ